jgi:23S rRNA (guanosine2251-2'-O)-methyltransferase
VTRESYQEKKARFERMLTVYGRNAVLETLQDDTLDCHAVHLASSNRSARVLQQIEKAATARGIPVQHHSREALARISRNGRQDQGVAVDVLCPAFNSVEDYAAGVDSTQRQRLLALDGITNPQNLGMIIRSAAAGNINGIVLARRGNAALGPLVIKASAGTVYRAPLLLCDDLVEALTLLRERGFTICSLEASARQSLFEAADNSAAVYILGNETTGVSAPVSALAQRHLHIPMRNGVESLNVAVSASLIAYADYLER